MDALPRHSDKNEIEEITGISCPECPGVLAVIRKHDHLTFRCRIGHAFSLQDLIISKESRLEDALWATLTALEELSTLLRDVVALREKVPATKRTLERRVAQASAHADAIRRIIDQNEPASFGEALDGRGGGS